MRRLSFIKMHGLGNDFVVVNHLVAEPIAITPDLAKKLCDRRFGIGADQVLWLRRPRGQADARMEILNADGSIAEMCGNGIRAVAVFLHRDGPTAGKGSYLIETLAGNLRVEMRGPDEVAVDMGEPKLSPVSELQLGSFKLPFLEVNMGNPHAVFFEDQSPEIAAADALLSLGPRIETHGRFPGRTNVEFIQVIGSNTIDVRVWERGAGATLACGTGACASAVAAIATGRAKSPLRVGLPGGELRIEWSPGSHVIMEGPAIEVFRGEIEIEQNG